MNDVIRITEEMRNTFYENFNEEIEFVKELL